MLVFHDLLGYFDRFSPKHNKRYANLRPIIVDAVKQYVDEVHTRAFPTAENSFAIDDAEFEAFVQQARSALRALTVNAWKKAKRWEDH